MTSKKIAVVMDCDDTLARDTTSVLVKEITDDIRGFWKDVDEMEKRGWDRPIAWTTLMLREAEAHSSRIDMALLNRAVTKLQFYDGALDLEARLKDYALRTDKRGGGSTEVSIHVVTSGFEDLLNLSPLKAAVSEIWGSLLEFDESSGAARGPKSSVSFTEKTRFIFAINKGITKRELRERPTRVNDLVPRSARPVPFENMIYVGDGKSDIPCYSLIEQMGGAAIGVRKESQDDDAEGPRLWDFRPRWGPFHPDYRDEADLTKLLQDLIHDVIVR